MLKHFDLVTGAYAATIGVGGISTFIKSGMIFISVKTVNSYSSFYCLKKC